MWTTTFLIAAIISLLVKWFWSRKARFNLFNSLGIPGPKPSLFNGNTTQMRKMGGLHPWMQSGKETYGKVWGYFEAVLPILVVSDVEIIRQILIQDFSKFNNRKQLSLARMQEKYINVFDAEGNRWKRLRTISAPSFTAKRMKEMSPLINKIVDNLMMLWDKHSKSGEPFNIHGEFQKLTLDVIASTAFGLDTQSIATGDSVFLRKVRELFEIAGAQRKRSPIRTIVFFLLMNVPGLQFFFGKFLTGYMVQYLQWYYDAAEKIILERQKNPSEVRDFVTLMVEANQLNPNVSEQNVNADVDKDSFDNEQIASGNTDKVLKGLTTEEMQAQCFVFLTAGYETTSTALAFLAYELARHPDVQQKLQEEIDEHFSDTNCKPDYTSVSKLKYMDMVVNENLRLHNIAALATTRVCAKACRVGPYNIPQGTVIQIDSNQVMLDEEIWGPEDPNEFIPERFSPERKSDRHAMAFLAFGAGPRNCVGMRFALMEIKIALSRLLKTYSVKACDRTEVPLPVAKNNIQAPIKGVYVTMHKRSSED